MKRCTKCGETKALEAFVKDKRSPQGRAARCKTCINADQRRRHVENGHGKRKREWRNENRAHVRQGNRQRGYRWRKRNPERARRKSSEATRLRRRQDPGYWRRWYAAHADSERERSRKVMREIRETRPELGRAARQRHRQKNAERVRQRERASTHQRRATKAATAHSLLGGYSYRYMVEFITELLTKPCDYCGETAATLDHVVPLSRGGLHIPANLAPACSSCNSSKWNRLLHEWTR